MDTIKTTNTSPFRQIHFRLLQTLIIVGLILSIVGGTSSFSSDGTFTVKPLSKIAIILYIVAYVTEVFIAGLTFISYQSARTERRLLLAVIAALPFIFIRLMYSVLGVIAHLHAFSVFNGSVAAFALMAVVSELLVISMYLLAGWNAPVRDWQPALATGDPSLPLTSGARGDRGLP